MDSLVRGRSAARRLRLVRPAPVRRTLAANYAACALRAALEQDAGVVVDYAIASVEQAKLAVLDAIAGRMEAEQARKAAR